MKIVTGSATAKGCDWGLGDTDGVMVHLEEAFRTRAVRMVTPSDPFFAEVESNARYRDLMARLRLPIRRESLAWGSVDARRTVAVGFGSWDLGFGISRMVPVRGFEPRFDG